MCGLDPIHLSLSWRKATVFKHWIHKRKGKLNKEVAFTNQTTILIITSIITISWSLLILLSVKYVDYV